jgi:hypothetical protein
LRRGIADPTAISRFDEFENGRTRASARLLLEIDVGERLPIAVADDEAGVGFLDGLGRRLALKAPHQKEAKVLSMSWQLGD